MKSYKLLENYDELYIDDKHRHHLYRNCEELTKGIEAIYATSYKNDWWKYRDVYGFEHLIDNNGIEKTKDIKTMLVECYKNNYWKYMSKNGSWNIIDPSGVNLTQNISSIIYDCIVYPDGNIDIKIDKDSDNYIPLNKE